MKIRRLALAITFGSLVLIGSAYLLAFFPALPQSWSAGAMVLGVSSIMASITALGALDGGHDRVRLLTLVALFLILCTAFGAALILPPEAGAEPNLWLGLPRRASVIIYGVGILPLLIMPITYAVTFQDHSDAADEIRRRLRSEAGAGMEEMGTDDEGGRTATISASGPDEELDHIPLTGPDR